jgi:hypothetical protein
MLNNYLKTIKTTRKKESEEKAHKSIDTFM